MDSIIHILARISEIMENHGFQMTDVIGDDDAFYATIRPNDPSEVPDIFFHRAVVPHLAEFGYEIELQSDFALGNGGIQFLARKKEVIDDTF